MANVQIKTLKQLITDIAEYSYDHGDYIVIKDTNKEKEVQKFVDSYLPGAEIIKDGKDGTAVAIRGKAEESKGTKGNEEINCAGYLLYDLSGQTGEWVIVSFDSLDKVEEHILSDGGYLNVYCTDMLVLENGEFKPFEIYFDGDNEKTIVLDKDIIDDAFDLNAMRPKISVHWIEKEEEYNANA